MLALTRAMLLEHLQQLPAIIDLYQARDPRFSERSATWLTDVEASLQRLRHPLVGLVAAERGRLLAVSDGYRELDASAQGASRRKAGNVTIVSILSRVEAAVLSDMTRIDAQLDAWREKMVQFIAVATNGHPIPLRSTEPREAWLQRVWNSLDGTPETQNMRTYLAGAMTRSDRLYILSDILDNIENNLTDA